MQIPPLSKSNHVIDVFAHGLGPDGSGLNTAVTDDFGGECAQQGLALIGGLAELCEALSVTHHFEGGGFGGVGAGGEDGCVGDLGSGEGAQGARACVILIGKVIG